MTRMDSAVGCCDAFFGGIADELLCCLHRILFAAQTDAPSRRRCLRKYLVLPPRHTQKPTLHTRPTQPPVTKAMPLCSCGCARQVWRSYIASGRSLCPMVGGVEIALYDPHGCFKRLRAIYPELAARVAAKLNLPQDELDSIAMDTADDGLLETLLSHCLSALLVKKRRREVMYGRARHVHDNLQHAPSEAPPPTEEDQQHQEEEGPPKKKQKKQPPVPPEIVRLLRNQGPSALKSPQRLEEFAKIYLAMAAEVLERTGAAENVKQPFFKELDASTQETMRTRDRCTFNTVSDTTTLAIVGEMWRLKDDGPQLLYHVASAATVLNSRERYQAFVDHLDVRAPLSAQQFRELYLAKFGKEEAPPKALQQCALATLTRSRRSATEDWDNKSFQGSAMFIEALGARCEATWAKLAELLVGPAAPADLQEAPAVAVLRQELGLGPFMAQHVARLLSVIHPKLYNLERLDCGAGAVQGLLLMYGASKEEARVWKSMLKPGETRALFANLLRHLPGELRKLDKTCVLYLAEEHFLWPFAARTVQHMLCEARKVWAPEGRPARHVATPDDVYRQLWLDAVAAYRRCASLEAGLGRPQQMSFKKTFVDPPVCWQAPFDGQ